MKKGILQIDSIPIIVEENSILEITTRDVGYFTHSFFKYPCKFIPQVPKWAIEKYTKENDLVLDCFAGSGTTGAAAREQKRNWILIEQDKEYIKLIKRRLEL